MKSVWSASMRKWKSLAARFFLFTVAALGITAAYAQDAPEVVIKKLSEDMVQTLKTDKAIVAGDVRKIAAYVDTRIMPIVNMERMTAQAVGRPYLQATVEQKKRLQEEYKNLILATYSGALSQFKNETVEVLPQRSNSTDDEKEVLVKTRIVGRPEPILLDYRLEKNTKGWQIYNVSVGGAVWMNDTFRGQFTPIIKDKGLDGLIDAMAERNKRLSGKS